MVGTVDAGRIGSGSDLTGLGTAIALVEPARLPYPTIRGTHRLQKATEAERDQALAQAQQEAQRNRELAAPLARLQRRAPDDDPAS